MPLFEHRGRAPVVDPSAYGLSRAAPARKRMERQAAWFGAHRDHAEVPRRG